MTDLQYRRLAALTAAVRAAGYAGTIDATALPTITLVPEDAAARAVVTGWDWSQAADDAASRTAAVADLNTPNDPLTAKLWSVVLLLVDELNALRQWDMAFKAATAAATTLADLKTRVAALANLPDRTAAQAKQAVRDRITNNQTGS